MEYTRYRFRHFVFRLIACLAFLPPFTRGATVRDTAAGDTTIARDSVPVPDTSAAEQDMPDPDGTAVTAVDSVHHEDETPDTAVPVSDGGSVASGPDSVITREPFCTTCIDCRSIRTGMIHRDMPCRQLCPTGEDSGTILFKRGLVHYRAFELIAALSCFRRAAELSDFIAPFAYEQIGDIEHHELQRPGNAIIAYRSAMEDGLPDAYHTLLHGKIFTVLRDNRDLRDQISWFTALIGDTSRLVAGEEWLVDFFGALLENRKWGMLDSVLSMYVDTSFGALGCAIFKQFTLDRVPDSLLSTMRVFSIARKLHYCKQYDAASTWLHKALSRDEFNESVPAEEYMLFRARLNYDMGNFGNAAKWYGKCTKRFGPQPDALLALARAYRKIGRQSRAEYWYDQHIKLFPRHRTTHDILWYRGRTSEENGQYAAARVLYRKLYTYHRSGSKAHNAWVRSGLCYFKEEEYRKAIAKFNTFLKKYPQSYLTTNALYWRGKSRLRIRQYEKAEADFRKIISLNPFDYYSFRARDFLRFMEQPVEDAFAVDSSRDIEYARYWLDSLSRRAPGPGPADSLAFERGKLLALLGMGRHAECFLKPLERRYPGQLRMQFDIAMLYELNNRLASAYRAARYLAWRIPPRHRAKIPLPVLRMLYPPYFNESIEVQAFRNDLDPMLVRALIRQESIFNPRIESPVGAVGLMQIMPYTGEAIARSLGEVFFLDSLYSSHVNVRYGTYYLRELLDQFKGNSVLALAGYNGGPHNVKRWYAANRERTFDMFIEDIGYTETRGYVKKVLANLWTYRQLFKIPAYTRLTSLIHDGGMYDQALIQSGR